jgi:hypothetical protein
MSGTAAGRIAALLRKHFPAGLVDPTESFVRIVKTHLASAVSPLQLQSPCLVFGSAPNPILPRGFTSKWGLVTANASQSGLASLGVDRDPDVTIITRQLSNKDQADLSALNALRGCSTRHLILTGQQASGVDCVNLLRKVDYRFLRLDIIDQWQRSKVAYQVLGQYVALSSGHEKKISTGMFAALLALYSGARPVVLAGISLSSAGHSYNELKTKRYHVRADAAALSLACRQGLPLFAVDRQLADEAGLPLWRD